MLALAACFSYVIFSLFALYRGWIMSTVNREHLNFSFVLTLWATFYMYVVFTVLWIGHSTKNEVLLVLKNGLWRPLIPIFFCKAKFTGVLLHRAINKCYDTEIVGRVCLIWCQIYTKLLTSNVDIRWWHFLIKSTTELPMQLVIYFPLIGHYCIR